MQRILLRVNTSFPSCIFDHSETRWLWLSIHSSSICFARNTSCCFLHTFYARRVSSVTNDGEPQSSRKIVLTVILRTDVRYFFSQTRRCVRLCGLGLNECDTTRIHGNDFADISSGNAKRCLTMTTSRYYVGPSYFVRDTQVERASALFFIDIQSWIAENRCKCVLKFKRFK